MEHYEQSPNMIHMESFCNPKYKIDLKKMNIDQRWECDNRIPTWTFGMMNFSNDINFVQNGGMINATDDFTLKVLGTKEEDGPHEVIATRKIRYNGNWLKVDAD